jgi:branched-subunit amino acid transport protein
MTRDVYLARVNSARCLNKVRLVTVTQRIAMSATAVALAPARVRPKQAVRLLPLCSAIVYTLVIVAAVLHHEPWADEAQAWLLARDASLGDLWLRLMHYEGSPGLWQTLLHGLVAIGLPYRAYNFVSALFGLAAVWMLIRYAPLPLPARVLLPFTYYFCYQYSVIARSYALFAPLLFATALLFRKAAQKPFLFTMLLCLIAGISVHGVVISGGIWLIAYVPYLFRWRDVPGHQQRRLLAAGLFYGLVVLVFILCAWPAKDVAFAEHRGLANLRYMPDVVKATLAGAFTGEWITSLAVLGLSFPFLWRGRGWRFFVPVTATLLIFGTLVYAQVWHFGILFLVWLFAIWISAQQTKITKATVIALGVVIACQCYWTAHAIYYDWGNAYSGSAQAAAYLRQAGTLPGSLYAIGYPCTAIQPYFATNLYSDFHHGGSAAYWDWSQRNTADDPSALFSSPRRDQVLVGYKNTPEKSRWAKLLRLLGYEQTRHFEGNTFWQTGIFESESFDLYRRGTGESPIEAASFINAADPDHAVQLLAGFYGVEMKAWRWTAKKFSVALKPPPGSQHEGATLNLSLYVPPIQIQMLGPVTLSPNLDGYALPTRTFSAPGSYTYSAVVPASQLRSALVTVNFTWDKAVTTLKTDARELGAVVNSVGFFPPAER